MNWNDEDVKFVEKAIEIKARGYFIDGGQVTEVYNRVLDKRATPTNCGSCIRARINELEASLNQFKKLNEKVEEEKKEDTPEPKKENKKPKAKK